MISKGEIKQKIIDVINLFVPDTNTVSSFDENIFNESLLKIASDSVKAIHFVSLIESEFEIEINDEHINYEFFSDIEYIINAIVSCS
jgi:acyl carrier protein